MVRGIGEPLSFEAERTVLLVGPARLSGVFSVQEIAGVELQAGLIRIPLKRDACGGRHAVGSGFAHFFLSVAERVGVVEAFSGCQLFIAYAALPLDAADAGEF